MPKTFTSGVSFISGIILAINAENSYPNSQSEQTVMNAPVTEQHTLGGNGCSKAVILGKKLELQTLYSLIAREYQQVTLAETTQDIEHLKPGKQPFKLAVITDSFQENLSRKLINTIKQKINPESMICLSKAFDAEKERELRSTGLIFLGSYQNFFEFSDDIISHTFASKHEMLNDDRKRHAGVLEKRLVKNTVPLKSTLRRIAFFAGAAISSILATSIEWIIAVIATVCLAFPVSIVLLFRKYLQGIPVFTTRTICGAGRRPVIIREFNKIRAPFHDLPLFFHLFTGQLALVGTSIKDWGNAGVKPEHAYISSVKPGIVSLWDIRQASKIAHEGQLDIEWEYVFKKQPFYDFMLLLRAIPGLLYSENPERVPGGFHLLGLDIDNFTMEEAVRVIGHNLENRQQQSVFFVNPDCLNKMVSDPAYYRVLKESDYIFPDGIGLILAGKIMKSPLKENINGTDMLPFLCRMASEHGYRIFLLGGKPGIAEEAAKKIIETYQVEIAGTEHGYFNHHKESNAVIEKINESGADILLVAFGAPLQEKWIAEHRNRLNTLIIMGVGGLFDFYSGNIKRAPLWLREIGFEWTYRLLQEPGRMWQRYVIGNPLFLYRVMKWKIFTNSL
jgi:N-acetylglucosaminyldiphosphoundecaprenol N-acetyl-beta-D-mannosaminyltransferase